jgi:hypothetical protein
MYGSSVFRNVNDDGANQPEEKDDRQGGKNPVLDGQA